MAIQYLAAKNIQGLSSDTKPTNVDDGSIFRETDTGNVWFMISGTWTERPVRTLESDYDVYLHSSTIKARNNLTGLVKYTGTDIGSVVNTIIADFTSTGAKIRFSDNTFTINTPITIPTTDAGSSKPWHFQGYKPANVRGSATQFDIGSSFPDQRYVFECVADDDSNENATVRIDGLYVNNRSFAKDGNGTTNILGTSTMIDAGFIKFEADRTTTVGGATLLHLQDITGHYLWRGIHILGYVYWPVIWNCTFSEFNDNFVGDFDLKFARGSGGATHGSTVENKGADIRNFRTTHVGGRNDGRGSMNNGAVFFGGYHNVQHMFFNGRKYNDAVYSWKQCFSSVFDDIGNIDLWTTQGTNFQAVFLFDTDDPDGTDATTDYSCYNNLVRKLTGQHASGTIKFLNSPFRNRIEAYAYWGAHISINDAGAGIENVIELIEGQQKVATASAKVTSTNSLVKIIDKRVGAKNDGFSTKSGDASTTAFTIAHGCFATPANYYVYPVTADAMGAFDVTVDSTNITITYKVAPPTGTNNLKYSWYASVY